MRATIMHKPHDVRVESARAALAERLGRDGLSHISLTSLHIGAQVDLATFQQELAGAHIGKGNGGESL